MTSPSESPTPNRKGDGQRPTSAGRFGIRRLRWLILLILVGPCVVLQAPLEVGRWKLAAAIQARSAGQKEQAYAELARAMKRIPNNPDLYLQRRLARWKTAQPTRHWQTTTGCWSSAGESSKALCI